MNIHKFQKQKTMSGMGVVSITLVAFDKDGRRIGVARLNSDDKKAIKDAAKSIKENIAAFESRPKTTVEFTDFTESEIETL